MQGSNPREAVLLETTQEEGAEGCVNNQDTGVYAPWASSEAGED